MSAVLIDPKRPHRLVRKHKIRGIWRLKLSCGHEAFSLISEPHHASLTRWCYPCDRWVRILTSVESRFKIADKASRNVMKDHEHE